MNTINVSVEMEKIKSISNHFFLSMIMIDVKLSFCQQNEWSLQQIYYD